ncbi:MAG: portal protein [Candidatus Thorarchaeota archaeon]
MIPGEVAREKHLSEEDRKLLRRIGLTLSQLREDVLKDTQVQYDRQSIYHQITRSLEHPLVSGALELYAGYCTNYSQLHNATVWITSENPKYQRELTKFLDSIGIEEKIFDWTYSTGGYGDLFVKVNGVPGSGVVSVDDNEHPLNISRVDHEGVLVGFYRTPLGQTDERQKLIPPWEFVHFRLLGAKKKRPKFGDPLYTEFRTMHLLTGMDVKQVTTRYGTSLLINALPIYRRLRLAEDSLLLSRLTRGIIRYIWKLKVNSSNMEAVAELVDQYSTMLKRARAIDSSIGSLNYDSKSNPMSAVEDIFVPVWDDTGDLTYDKIGGEVDIRWIVDIEDLRNQLACALRCPLSLLGGFVQEASGQLGSEIIEKLDIRFARNARRLQRAIKNGIKRLCQIHLAYMNMDPDPRLFEVNMSETSTAEEESLKESLESGVDIVQKILDVLDKVAGPEGEEIDRVEVINYLNRKILKLEDFDVDNFLKSKKLGESKKLKEEKERKTLKEKRLGPFFDLDTTSYLPVDLNEHSRKNLTSWLASERHREVWEKKFGDAYVEPVEDEDKPKGQMKFSW